MNAELSIAKDAAIEAGGLILSYYKADYEPVTYTHLTLPTTPYV